MTARVAIVGGGTAGHVYPGLALAGTLRERGHDVTFLGTETGLEAKLVPAAGFPFRVIRARPFVRQRARAMLRAPFVAMAAVRESRPLVRRADVVVGMGGYVSVPAAVAAWREGVPLVLHEQNAIPGLANRALSRMARTVALSFGDAARFFPLRARIEVTGNPVRNEVLRVPIDREALAKEARQEFDLEEPRRTVLIFGGSLGALHIDRAAVGASRVLRHRSDLQLLLITGPTHLEAVERAMAQPEGLAGGGSNLLLRRVGYADRMDLAYACADLVVARAGATTVAELTACGLPSVLVPYPYATRDHQAANARAVQRAGGAIVLLDDQLSAESLAERISTLIDDEERLESMADGARAFGRPDASDRLADAVTGVAA